jgi:hypothetical protein
MAYCTAYALFSFVPTPRQSWLMDKSGVLSGTWYTGYGETPEASGLKELPAGSFYTEPANVAHYVEIREPTVIQVSGTGPSGRKFVGPNAPK